MMMYMHFICLYGHYVPMYIHILILMSEILHNIHMKNPEFIYQDDYN